MRNLLLCFALLLLSIGAKANHLVGADLYYTWVTGNQYKVTVILYGDCGSASSTTAFAGLSTSVPRVCVYDGTTNVATLALAIQAPTNGIEITPVCPSDTANTQCHIVTSTTPGIKKFVYTAMYTVPYLSANWKFIFNGYLGGSFIAGRATSLTNISSTPVTYIQLEATLNNLGSITNSNPILTILPVPFFCQAGNDTYNPGAVDADGDSLSFALVPAVNGSAAGCSLGSGPVTYLTTYPYSGTNPLHTFSGAVGFDALTGQISFVPDITQRSVVVYTINEYRGNVLIGSMQREMSFTVITCPTPTPTGGMTSATNGTLDDTSHFHICAETGPFAITLNSSGATPLTNVTVTNTGLPPGAVFSVAGNGTPNPVTTISWTSNGVTPGTYTFYVTFTDDACPLQGTQTRAFTINIYPIPTLAYTVIRPKSCAGDAIVSISPGGLGSPWSVMVLDATGAHIDSNIGVTGTYLDTLGTGNDTLVIYSAVSSFCNSRNPIAIPVATFVTISATKTDPTFCGNNDGTLTISGLNPLEQDTLFFTLNGVPNTGLPIFSSSGGTYVMNGLCAGTYNNMYVKFGSCTSPAIGPITLNNPGFTINRLEYHQPTACGFNDGWIKIIGMHPGQQDTIKYTLNGAPQTPVTNYVATDSAITITNLGAGTYSNFVANTVGSCPGSPSGCTSNMLGPITLVDTPINANFNFVVHMGCNGDTVVFTNLSTPLTPVPLYYRWYFGDGGTDTSRNPVHIYHPSTATTYTIKLIVTNTQCVDSNVFQTVTFPAQIKAMFTSTPDTFICQKSSVAFRDTSTGAIVNYAWTFGDGGTATGKDPIHTFVNSGAYPVTLTITDGIPCSDIATKIVQVDSSTIITMRASDTVICRGGQVTFEGTYTSIGYTGNLWTFGDGGSYSNANPISHSFDAVGILPVTLTVYYRACNTAIVTRNVKVYDNPNIYLGPDSAICPGSTEIELYDLTNAGNPLATWLWSTGSTASHIVTTEPGYYSATVTINGCIATDTVWIANDCYISFPNVFTPNGDGINDYFFPRNLLARGLTSFKMDIYNRWGQNIYSTTSTDGQGWDGKFNNEPQPQGVFIYVIEAKFKDGQKIKKQGNVTLVR